MGPNGSGKSTLSYVLAGREGYEVTGGKVTLDGADLLAMAPDERAAKGVFPGLSISNRDPRRRHHAVPQGGAQCAAQGARGEPEMSTPDFMRLIRERALRLGISPEMLKRPVNVGFSGGEKKRAEILQMAVLEPGSASWTRPIRASTSTPCECRGRRQRLRSPDRAMIVITHYSGCSNISFPTGCMFCRKGGSSGPATSGWPSSSRSAAMPITSGTPRNEHAPPQHRRRAGLSPGRPMPPADVSDARRSRGSWRPGCRIGGWRTGGGPTSGSCWRGPFRRQGKGDRRAAIRRSPALGLGRVRRSRLIIAEASSGRRCRSCRFPAAFRPLDSRPRRGPGQIRCSGSTRLSSPAASGSRSRREKLSIADRSHRRQPVRIRRPIVPAFNRARQRRPLTLIESHFGPNGSYVSLPVTAWWLRGAARPHQDPGGSRRRMPSVAQPISSSARCGVARLHLLDRRRGHPQSGLRLLRRRGGRCPGDRQLSHSWPTALRHPARHRP